LLAGPEQPGDALPAALLSSADLLQRQPLRPQLGGQCLDGPPVPQLGEQLPRPGQQFGLEAAHVLSVGALTAGTAYVQITILSRSF